MSMCNLIEVCGFVESVMVGLGCRQSNKKAKLVPVRTIQRTIAKVLENKVVADEIDDLASLPRPEMPVFLSDYMLKTYGVKSMAMQNLGRQRPTCISKALLM